ncbi:Endoribonuclease YbeY [invertebrate metagenome]|uniref:Endoribonuclease YbeY n=1 Tax=invertebrate metagenome TaxID=1711999 RepID=A0A2H9T6M5_9ZZZZ
MSSVHIDLQIACDFPGLPDASLMEKWSAAAVGGRKKRSEISVRIVGPEEGRALNLQWRQKDYATNILSFPAELPDIIHSSLLGDLVICAPVVEREAQEQGKTLMEHWAHMVIHGTLHLLGYDHIEEIDAKEMEAIEKKALLGLGYPDPYKDDQL